MSMGWVHANTPDRPCYQGNARRAVPPPVHSCNSVEDVGVMKPSGVWLLLQLKATYRGTRAGGANHRSAERKQTQVVVWWRRGLRDLTNSPPRCNAETPIPYYAGWVSTDCKLRCTHCGSVLGQLSRAF